MSKNKSQLAFWVNAIIYHSLFDGLLSDVNGLSSFLDSKAAHLKESEPPEFDDENSEAEYATTLEQYDDIFPLLLCNSFIITLAYILEQELRNFADTLSKVTKLDHDLTMNQTGFFDRFKLYISKTAQVPYDFGAKQWNDIKGLVEVRNLIVHKSGVLDKSPRSKTILEFNKSYQRLTIKGNQIYPTIPFCNDMISLVHKFLRDLTDAAYEHFR